MKSIFSYLVFTLFFLTFSWYGSCEEDLFASYFVDQHKETDDKGVKILVDGKLPKYIIGNLIRVGPTINQTPKRNYTNFLDGFGRVSKWSINGLDSTISYQSKIIRSLQYNASNDAQDIIAHVTQQPTDPPMKSGRLSSKKHGQYRRHNHEAQ